MGLFSCFRAAPPAQDDSSSFSAALPALAASSSSRNLRTAAPAAGAPPFVPRSVAELHPEYAHAEPYHFAAKTESARLVLESATGHSAALRAPPPKASGAAAFDARDAAPPVLLVVENESPDDVERAGRERAGRESSAHNDAPQPAATAPAPAHATAPASSPAPAPTPAPVIPNSPSGGSEEEREAERVAAESLAGKMAARKKSKTKTAKVKKAAAAKAATLDIDDDENAPENPQPGARASVRSRAKVTAGGAVAAAAAVGGGAAAAASAMPASAGHFTRDTVEPLHTSPMALGSVSGSATLKPALSGKSPKQGSHSFRKTVSFREEKPVIIGDSPPRGVVAPVARAPLAAMASPTAPEGHDALAARGALSRRKSQSFEGRLPSGPGAQEYADMRARQEAMPRVSTAESVRASKRRQSMAVRDALSQQIRGVPRSAMLAYAENETSETGAPSEYTEFEEASAVEPLSDGWFDDATSVTSGLHIPRSPSARSGASGALSRNTSGLSGAPAYDDPRRMSMVGQRTRSTKSIRLPPPVQSGVVPRPPPPPPFEPSRGRVRSVHHAPKPPPAHESFRHLKSIGASEAMSIEIAQSGEVY